MPSEWECAEALREVKWAGGKLDGMEAVYTDDYPAYNFLASLAHHETVNHSSGEVCKGKSPHMNFQFSGLRTQHSEATAKRKFTYTPPTTTETTATWTE